jgi:hypothetical protein
LSLFGSQGSESLVTFVATQGLKTCCVVWQMGECQHSTCYYKDSLQWLMASWDCEDFFALEKSAMEFFCDEV